MRGGALRTYGAAVALCLLALAGAPMAEAGTIWVTDGTMSPGGSGSCGAFGFEESACTVRRQQRLPGGRDVDQRRLVCPGRRQRILDDDRSGGDHDQRGVDGEQRRVEQRPRQRLGGGRLLAERRQRPVRRIDPGARAAMVQHGLEGVLGYQQPVLWHPTGLHPLGQPGTVLGRFEPSIYCRRRRARGNRDNGTVRDGLNSLWSEPAGQYVWNPPG